MSERQISWNLTFISDPGHGWLRVPLSDIAALGIESEISAFSFKDTEFAYLEEDCDCTVFQKACEAKHISFPKITEEYVEYFDRNRPRFGATS